MNRFSVRWRSRSDEANRTSSSSKSKEAILKSPTVVLDASWVPFFGGFRHIRLISRLRGRPRTHWRDLIRYQVQECLGIPQEEPENFAGNKII